MPFASQSDINLVLGIFQVPRQRPLRRERSLRGESATPTRMKRNLRAAVKGLDLNLGSLLPALADDGVNETDLRALSDAAAGTARQ